MNTLHIVDFDRTMFRTDDFANDLIHSFARDQHISSEEQGKLIDELGAPDSFDITSELGRLGITMAQLTDTARVLEDTYLYEDVKPFIDETPQVIAMTSALHEAFQQLKLEQSGLPDVIPCVITHDNKGQLLQSLIDAGELEAFLRDQGYDGHFDKVILVDDKPSQLLPLQGSEVELVLMQRDDAKYPPLDEQRGIFRIISSLNEI